MEPIIKNYRDNIQAGVVSTRLISLDDGPPTVTLSYQHFEDGQTSPHHIHPWEHEVYIMEGSGTLFCDKVEYPVKAGDAIFIPGDVDHYTLNNGGDGPMKRIEINPIVAAQSGGAQNDGGEGTGKPPTILNIADVDLTPGSARPILTAAEGVINYTMFYRGLEPDESSPMHAHGWEHQAYILKGTCTLVCDGVDFRVTEGDAILVPPHAEHEWRSDNGETAGWLVFNPIAR